MCIRDSCKIYEDNILGKLSDNRYATLDAQYEKEQSELNAEISTLEKAVKSYEKHEKDADRFIALIDKYENFDKDVYKRQALPLLISSPRPPIVKRYVYCPN